MNFDKTPNNLDEAIAQLEAGLSVEDRNWILAGKDPQIHFGFGMFMRNNWGLWKTGTPLKSWFESIGIFHADDCSGIIIDSFRRHIRNEPIDLDGQIKYYQDYWERAKKAEETGEPMEWETTVGGKIVKCVMNLSKIDPKD